ncbi:hypothetical protein AMAG_11117 [Allomyces macrogynus ATCC 38327]|uniref:CRAL-TRIO domain-containing protein n=1 Tax=Allomyces macrogynus (strain ATCC 38327) TaxID=578462 RepID=A0A0L0SSH9_ALLM3|nr:hypothetical protein AMAG_11117 [Allomyces macrogynus ATCC 38327]|eukprot:KNE65498.1 hypothetical protein AMAG_11117 [Allomyces macrogynus ATCC 38327]
MPVAVPVPDAITPTIKASENGSPPPSFQLTQPQTSDERVVSFLKEARQQSELVQLGVDDFTDVELYKFLIANGYNAATALTKLKSTLQWRATVDFTTIPYDDFSDLNAMGKLYVLPGANRRGLTTVVWRAKLHFPDPPRLPHLMRYIAYTVHWRWRLGLASDRITVIFDLADVSQRNRDLDMVIELAKTFNAHFPECLDEFYMFPSSFLASTLWSMVRPFLDKDTADKIILVSQPVFLTKCADLHEPTSIPERWGGSWTGEPVAAAEDVPLPPSAPASPTRMSFSGSGSGSPASPTRMSFSGSPTRAESPRKKKTGGEDGLGID